MGEPAIAVRALRKSFGAKEAVAGIDLDIAAGSFAGLVGPNGAGKTTSLSMMTGLLRPDSGQVLLKTPLSAGTNAPVAVDGDYVIAGEGVSLVPSQQRMIIAYKLGATGKLPDTVGS